jgi:hypothetical protein
VLGRFSVETKGRIRKKIEMRNGGQDDGMSGKIGAAEHGCRRNHGGGACERIHGGANHAVSYLALGVLDGMAMWL